MFFNFRGNLFQRFLLLSEGNGAFLYIGTGNVDFQHVHGLVRQLFHHFHVIRNGFSAHVHNHFCIILL